MVGYVENSALPETWARYTRRDGGNVVGSPKDAHSVSDTELNPNFNANSTPVCPTTPYHLVVYGVLRNQVTRCDAKFVR